MIQKQLTLFVSLFVLIYFESVFGGTTGKITGRVLDYKTGEPLIGTNVLVQGTSNGASTDKNGYFTIIDVSPGTYNVIVRYIGYVTVKITKVVVNIDKTTNLGDIKLKGSAVSVAEVVVQAKKPPIQKDLTSTESIINSKTIRQLPVTTLGEVISLQPGVVSQGGELHFRGGRGREVAYIIDGVPVSNAFSQSGGSNVDIENSMIKEVDVISGTFNAEYGSAQSGIVNIVTKGPAQKFSGSVEIYSGDWLSNKNSIFIGINHFNPIAEKDFQFSLTGPIVPDKLGFFATGRLNTGVSYYGYQNRFEPVDGWKIAAYENWYQEHNPNAFANTQAVYIPDSLSSGDMSVGPLNRSQLASGMAKLDFKPISTIRITDELFGSWSQSFGAPSVVDMYSPFGWGKSISWSYQNFLTFRHSIGSNLFYNFAFSYQHNQSDSFYRKDNKIAQYPGDSGIQLISTSADGFQIGGTGWFYNNKPRKNYRNLYLLNGDIDWQVDRHNFIKAGFEYKQNIDNTYNWGYVETIPWQRYAWPNNGEIDPAKYDFNTYWNMLINYWKNWTVTFDSVQYRKVKPSEYTLWRDYTIKPVQAALYLQDKIEMGEIIVNAGARLDMFKANEKYTINPRIESFLLGSAQNLQEAPMKFQISPRIGISFPISPTGAFHAAYGHFFQMPSFQYMFNEPLYSLTSLQLNGRLMGNANLDAEKTVSYEIGLQQEIVKNLSINITAYYKDFKNLLGVEEITTVDNIGYERFVNRDYGYSKGITLGITKGGNGFITGSLNYTLSYANGSHSDPETIQLIEASNTLGAAPIEYIGRSILPLNWDQRHTLNLIINFNKPNNWVISLIGNLDSGTPYSPTFVQPIPIPVQFFQQSGRLPTSWDITLKAKKFFNLGNLNCDVYLKIDNIFDHLNQEQVYSSSGTASYDAQLPEDTQLEEQKLQQENLFTLQQVYNHQDWYSSPRNIQLGLDVFF